jgi:fructose-1,6-bisphosphatase/inositol monophosphatase family enzyme
VRACWDDQYVSNGGQLALLALGTYRMIADLRASVAARHGRTTLTGKPYDISGAVLCAQEAGCVVTAVDGSPLDFPLDAETPVGFVGWANAATSERLAPHLAMALVR